MNGLAGILLVQQEETMAGTNILFALKAARGVLYFACAGSYASIGFLQRRSNPLGIAKKSRFWFILAMGVAVLGLMVSSEFQPWLTGMLRGMARAEGWYGHRRPFQFFALSLLAFISVVVFAKLIRHSRADGRRLRAIAGVVLLGLLLLVRTISYHMTDEVIGMHLVGPFTLGMTMEGTVLALLLFDAILYFSMAASLAPKI